MHFGAVTTERRKNRMDKIIMLLGALGMLYYQGLVCQRGICVRDINTTMMELSVVAFIIGFVAYYRSAIKNEH